MPRVKLTKTVIDALPIPSKDVVHWDTGSPGFGVKVTPKGRKVFIVLYRTAGAGSRLRKYTIGPYGRVTLNQARVTAQKVFAARLDGRDLAAEKKDSRRRMVADRVEDLLEAFIAQHVSQNRSAPEISRMLRREVGPAWGSRSIHEINKRDVIDVVNAIEQRGAPVAANKALKAIKTLFSLVHWPRGTRPVAGRRCAASGKTGDEGSGVERWRTCQNHPRCETDRCSLWRHRRSLGADRSAPGRGDTLHLG
jgi:Arm DNA-binding domain